MGVGYLNIPYYINNYAGVCCGLSGGSKICGKYGCGG